MIAIVIKSKGLDLLPAKLRRFRVGILARINRMLELSGQQVVGESREGYLSGPRPKKLGRRSGDLARSVGYKINGDRVVIGSNLRYAPIHEFGGVIVPRKAPRLIFKTLDGAWHSASRVVIPARPFLRPALKDSRPAILSIVKAQAEAALREALA